MKFVYYIALIPVFIAGVFLKSFSQSYSGDSVQAKTAFYPSQELYGDAWDTLYIRSNKLKDINNDSVFIQLITVDFPGFVIPVNGEVLSCFGWRRGRIHTGTDIRLQHGDTVNAAFPGKVRINRYISGYGNIVVVRHYNGLETCYAHLLKSLVKVNQDVKAGDVVGLGGRTGRATCNHLHFEIRFREEPVDPQIVFDFCNQSLFSDTLLVTDNLFINRSKPATNKLTAAGSEKYYNSYIIKQGDTLYSIARRYGTSVSAICEKNNLSENAVLRIGRALKL